VVVKKLIQEAVSKTVVVLMIEEAVATEEVADKAVIEEVVVDKARAVETVVVVREEEGNLNITGLKNNIEFFKSIDNVTTKKSKT
jgi:hypothetical protein